MPGCYGSLNEKLLTHFWKVIEGFCKELISKLILKKMNGSWSRKSTRDGRWREDGGGSLSVGKVLDKRKEYMRRLRRWGCEVHWRTNRKDSVCLGHGV